MRGGSVLGFLILSLSVGGDAAAQGTGGGGSDVEVEAVPEGGGDAVPGSKAADVPDSEKVNQGRAVLDRLRDVFSRVVKHLEEAREEKDVVKLNCVNEKLTAIKGLLKISEQSSVALEEAIARRDARRAQHEFEKLSIAGQKAEQLFAESEACVGELAVYAGDTEVAVEVNEDVPVADPVRVIQVPPVDIITDTNTSRPPAASPFQ